MPEEKTESPLPPSLRRRLLQRGMREGLLASFRMAPDVVLHLAPDGTILKANPQVEKLLGVTPEELKDKRISAVIKPHQNTHLDLTEILGKLALTRAGQMMEHPLQTTVQLRGKRGKPVEAYLRFLAYKPVGEGREPLILAHLTHTEPILKESKLFDQVLKINAAINAHEDIKKILQDTATRLSENMRAAVLIATVATPEDAKHNPEVKPGNELILRAGHGIEFGDFAPFSRIDFGKGLIGAAAAHREFKRVRNIQEYPSTLAPELDKKHNFRDSIAIPLLANGARAGEEPMLVGVIALYKHGEYADEEFAEHEVKLLHHMADNAATKIYQTKLSDRLRYLAEYDDLTGVYNRGKFFHALKEYLQPHKDRNKVPVHALPAGKKFGLLYVDADNLKLLNDVYGHAEGNHGLRSVAHALQEAAKQAGSGERAVVARLGGASGGGDEFAAFLPDADEEKTQAAAEHFRRILKDIVAKNHKFRDSDFGASVAHTTFVTEGKTDPEQHVFNLADLREKFKDWKQVDEEHYLDAMLKVPEEKMMALKTLTKRETGYVRKAFLEELAQRLHRDPTIGEAELLGLLGKHTNLETYNRAKRRLRG